MYHNISCLHHYYGINVSQYQLSASLLRYKCITISVAGTSTKVYLHHDCSCLHQYQGIIASRYQLPASIPRFNCNLRFDIICLHHYISSFLITSWMNKVNVTASKFSNFKKATSLKSNLV